MQQTEKYIDEDIAQYETTIIQSAMLALGAIFGSIALIDYGYPMLGLILGAGCLAFIFCGFDGLKKWMAERALVVAYKTQTRALFIFSEGESETHEDDTEIMQRVDFALAMLKRVQNPHGVVIWVVMFRDAYAFGFVTGSEGQFVKQIREAREGLTVRETREEYTAFCEEFQAQKEQEELVARRGNANADEWVAEHWFGQER